MIPESKVAELLFNITSVVFGLAIIFGFFFAIYAVCRVVINSANKVGGILGEAKDAYVSTYRAAMKEFQETDINLKNKDGGGGHRAKGFDDIKTEPGGTSMDFPDDLELADEDFDDADFI